MARKRMLDPSIWTDEGFLELSPIEKLLYMGMISHADDEGRGKASELSLKAQILPAENLTKDEIRAALANICEHIRVQIYEVNGNRYFQLDRWSEYQTINRPVPSKIPTPPNWGENAQTKDSRVNHEELTEDSLSFHGGLTEDSLPKERNRKERKGIEFIHTHAHEDESSPNQDPDPTPEPESESEGPGDEAASSGRKLIPVPESLSQDPGKPKHFQFVNDFQKKLNSKTGFMVSPDERAFLKGKELFARGRESPDWEKTLYQAMDAYFDDSRDFWFSRKLKSRKGRSLGQFAANLDTILEAISAKSDPEEDDLGSRLEVVI